MNKKFLFDKKYLKISVYAFSVMALLILLDKAMGNLSGFLTAFSHIKKTVLTVISPFLCGFFIAFFLNPIVRSFENGVLLKSSYFKKHKSLARNISILSTFVIVIGFIAWILIYFVPELYNSINSFILNFNQNITSLQNFYRNFFDQIEAIDSADVLKILDAVYKYFIGHAGNIPEITNFVLDRAIQTITLFINLFIGMFIAFYMLSEKERFAERFKKTLHVFLGKKKAEAVIFSSSRVQKTFEVFIVGKAVDSSIIGIICFIALSFFHLPYKGIISVVVGVTNMIPYFGPFIGYIPSTLIMLLSDPTKAGITLIVLIIIQIFDGNFLGPKILGASTGMGPVWVIFSIVIGGALGGPLGMFLGVPVFASFRLFITEYIDAKYDGIDLAEEIVKKDTENDTTEYD